MPRIAHALRYVVLLASAGGCRYDYDVMGFATTETGGSAGGSTGGTAGVPAMGTGSANVDGIAGTGGTAGAPATGSGGVSIGGSVSSTASASRGGTAGAPVTGSGGGSSGVPSTLRDVCRFNNTVIIEGTSSSDTLVSQDMAFAIASACGGVRRTRQVSQDAPGVLEASNRPLIGPNELALMSGGYVTQKAMAYLELNDTPIYTSVSEKDSFLAYTRAGTQLFSIPGGSFTTSHDVAIVTVAYEPISQTFILDIYGFNVVGTRAGAFFFANSLAPNLRNDSHQYYVIEWTDQDGDTAASSADQYVVLASG